MWIAKYIFSSKVVIFNDCILFYELRQNSNKTINKWHIHLKRRYELQFWFIFGRKTKRHIRRILDHICEEESLKPQIELVNVTLKREFVVKQSHSTASITFNEFRMINQTRIEKKVFNTFFNTC